MRPVNWVIPAIILGFFGGLLAFRPITGGARQDALLQRVIDADDRRDGAPETLQTLLEGMEATEVVTAQIAVRAVGRMERPDWLSHLRGPLHSTRREIRSEAANAVGQAVFGVTSDSAYGMLVERLAIESDPLVLGSIAQTIGRLGYGSAEAARAAESKILGSATRGDPLLITRGLESLVRQQRRAGYRLSENARQRLADWVRGPHASEDVRVRRMALAGLVGDGGVARPLLEAALEDPDEGVRRLAILGIGALENAGQRSELIMSAPFDISPMVRYEIVRLFGRFMQSSEGCLPLIDAVRDGSAHVGLLAEDLMSRGCPPADNVVSALVQIAAALPPSSDAPVDNWHYPTHAFVALAGAAPERARQILERYATHSQWQVRMYAARAATELNDVAALYRMARDDHWNVRTAAIQGLQQRVGHDADSVYIENLAANDYQLVLTSARALAGTTHASDAMPTVLAALARITNERKDTSRDPRVALMARIGELGSPNHADDLVPYTSDFDSVIADSAAAIVGRWRKTSVVATPRPLTRPPVPNVSELREWEHTVVTLHMHGGQNIEIALRPFDAPTNVARFVRLAKAGYFNGLTFHRVEPNFVIQGGSPGANEYAGDALYTRDELTAQAHWRGTVGVSTRGRDTGDGQIFINLTDNVRLDHNYTLFGEVTLGMNVVDTVVEGATIDRVSLRMVRPD